MMSKNSDKKRLTLAKLVDRLHTSVDVSATNNNNSVDKNESNQSIGFSNLISDIEKPNIDSSCYQDYSSKEMEEGSLINSNFKTSILEEPITTTCSLNDLPNNEDLDIALVKKTNESLNTKIAESDSISLGQRVSINGAEEGETICTEPILLLESSATCKPSRRKQQKTKKFIEEMSEEDLVYLENIQQFIQQQQQQHNEETQQLDTNEEAKTIVADDFIIPEGTVTVEPESTDTVSNKIRPNKRFKGDLLNTQIHCTACNKQIGFDGLFEVHRHPILKVLICKKCYSNCLDIAIEKDAEGSDELCRWCMEGGELICCDFCSHAFCKSCIRRNLGRTQLADVLQSGEDVKWKCYVCNVNLLLPAINYCTSVLKESIKRKAHEKKKKSKKSRLFRNALSTKTLDSTNCENLSSNASKLASQPNHAATKYLFKRSSKVLPRKIAANSYVEAGTASKEGKSNIESLNVVNVIDKLISAAHSMHMFLLSLSQDLKRTSRNEAFIKRKEFANSLQHAHKTFETSFELIWSSYVKQKTVIESPNDKSKNIRPTLPSLLDVLIGSKKTAALDTTTSNKKRQQRSSVADLMPYLPSSTNFLLINSDRGTERRLNRLSGRFKDIGSIDNTLFKSNQSVGIDQNCVIELLDSEDDEARLSPVSSNFPTDSKKRKRKTTSDTANKKVDLTNGQKKEVDGQHIAAASKCMDEEWIHLQQSADESDGIVIEDIKSLHADATSDNDEVNQLSVNIFDEQPETINNKNVSLSSKLVQTKSINKMLEGNQFNKNAFLKMTNKSTNSLNHKAITSIHKKIKNNFTKCKKPCLTYNVPIIKANHIIASTAPKAKTLPKASEHFNDKEIYIDLSDVDIEASDSKMDSLLSEPFVSPDELSSGFLAAELQCI